MLLFLVFRAKHVDSARSGIPTTVGVWLKIAARMWVYVLAFWCCSEWKGTAGVFILGDG